MRRKYTEEFKTEAVRFVRESDRPPARVSANLLYRWRSEDQAPFEAKRLFA
jgi:transposase-like protein